MDTGNDAFIDKPCAICGGVDCSFAALSYIDLACGYGSKNDGERVTLSICGRCADKLYEIIKKKE